MREALRGYTPKSLCLSSLEFNVCIDCNFLVSPGTRLGDQALISYNAAVSQKTMENRVRHATMYLTFALHYGVEILRPTVTDACLFQQYLANSLKHPVSRRCYTSGASIWIAERGGDPQTLVSPQAKRVAKGAENLNPHTPSPAPALTPHDLLSACEYLDQALSGPVVKAAMCIGFFSFLRSSNLLSPSVMLWRGPHTLLRKDISSGQHGLLLVIRSSKTIKKGTLPTILALPRIPGSIACPAKAWDSYIDRVPGSPDDPAFITPMGTPLTPGQMAVVLQAALHAKGCPYALQVTMHSLRRGGAQAALLANCPKEDIARHGTWRSQSGMKTYLPNNSSFRVADKLSALFAHK
jgi:hypothetical protein